MLNLTGKHSEVFHYDQNDGIMSEITWMGGFILADALMEAEKIRIDVVQATDELIRQRYSQYLTPKETASFAAQMLSTPKSFPACCLDLGSGTGILTVALAERFGWNIKADAVEIDSDMAAICDSTLS